MARKSKSTGDAAWVEETVPLGKIFLALDNPRHEPVESETDAIERLCKEEEVLPLARDIVRNGLNPLERLALVPVDPKKPTSGAYYVAEGNRRVCALKLLVDPDLAPAKFRSGFEKLAQNWTDPVAALTAPVFRDQDTVRVWLDRTHSGPQGGIGRKTWNSEQKQRFTGSSKNKLAQDVLDYAEAEGMINGEERKGKLTTAQRFLNPEAFQEAIGIDRSNPDGLNRTRPKEEFDALLRRFMRDLVEGTDVTSRKNKADILQYGRQLTSMPGITTSRVDPEALVAPQPKTTRIRKKPRKPKTARHVEYDHAIMQGLRSLGNEKLERLYYSITSIELAEHTLLVCVGAWSFIETLTAVHGRGDASFPAYLSKERLNKMGFSGKTTAIRSAIDRIHEFGNTTKHHHVSAIFNGDQLNNDVITIRDVILKLISEATP